MKRVREMRRRQLLAIAPVCIFTEAFAEEPAKRIKGDEGRITGLWEVSLPQQSGASSKQLVKFKTFGDRVTIRDFATGNEYAGTIRGDTIEFTMKVGGSPTGMPASASFAGRFAQETMTGVATVDGSKEAWMAMRLASAWLCSNHDPKHYAKTKQEMLDSTQRNQCEGWQKASSQ